MQRLCSLFARRQLTSLIQRDCILESLTSLELYALGSDQTGQKACSSGETLQPLTLERERQHYGYFGPYTFPDQPAVSEPTSLRSGSKTTLGERAQIVCDKLPSALSCGRSFQTTSCGFEPSLAGQRQLETSGDQEDPGHKEERHRQVTKPSESSQTC